MESLVQWISKPSMDILLVDNTTEMDAYIKINGWIEING